MNKYNKRLDKLEQQDPKIRYIICYCPPGECTCDAADAAEKDTVIRVVYWDDATDQPTGKGYTKSHPPSKPPAS